MNFRVTLILAIVMVVLAGLYFFLPSPKDQKLTAGSSTTLFEPKPKGVKTITYMVDGSKELAFEHDGDEWRMTYPISASVEKYQLENIADKLKDASYNQKFSPEQTG